MKKITNLEELKGIELRLMRAVHECCEENGLYYTLAYGSLIGAVRHQGFIPWDDDIDVFLPRADYERFVRLFPAWAEDRRMTVVNHRTGIYYGRPMSKVIDLRTCLTEPGFRGDDPIGVFVDIWPLDGLPENEAQRDRTVRRIRRLNRALHGKIDASPRPGGLKGLKRQVRNLPFLFLRHQQIVSRLCEVSSSAGGEDARFLINPGKPSRILEKAWLEKRTLCPFEDAAFYIPDGYDAMLQCQYGDWRTFPPPEKQLPHHEVNAWWKEENE